MSWQPELDELRQRERMARAMGGPDKVRRQHEGGRLTVRERIDGLLDEGSFHEIGAIAGTAAYGDAGQLQSLTPSNCVMGRGTIDGRPVVAVGDDFTVRGGSADATIREKPQMAEEMAHALRLPIVRIIEGSGGGGSVKTIETTGRANLPGRIGSTLYYYHTTANLGLVPVVALGLGSVAGLGAARLAASHYSVMTKATSAMFVAGPPLVAHLGQALDRHELGGWEIQTRAGAVDRCRRDRGGSVRARPPVPVLSAVFGLRGRSAPPARGRPGPARGEPLHRDPARPAQGLPDAPDRRGGGRPGIVLRDRALSSAARSSPGSPAPTAYRSRCWRATPISTAAAGPPRPARRSSALSIWPRPFTCRSSISATARAFTSGSTPSARRRSGTGCGRWRRSTSRACRGARFWSATSSASPVRSTSPRAGSRCAMPGSRRAGARCRSKAGSRPPTAPSSTPPPTRPPSAPRSSERLNRLRSPFRTAETFWVEEIIDPRDTRRLLCDFARLAEPLRTPGPSAFPMRP